MFVVSGVATDNRAVSTILPSNLNTGSLAPIFPIKNYLANMVSVIGLVS